MKTPKLIINILVAALLPACSSLTPAQKQAIASDAEAIGNAVIPIASTALGQPLGAAVGTAIWDDAWGAYAAVQAGQTAASGTSTPGVGAAIQSNLPANSTTSTILSVLQTVAPNFDQYVQ